MTTWVYHSVLFRLLLKMSCRSRRKKDWLEVMRLEEDLSFLDAGQAAEHAPDAADAKKQQ